MTATTMIDTPTSVVNNVSNDVRRQTGWGCDGMLIRNISFTKHPQVSHEHDVSETDDVSECTSSVLSSSSSMASFVQQSTAQVEEDQEHQPGNHSSRSQSQCHQWSNHPPHAPRHGEIKIREGPLHSPQTYRSSSNEYLLDYGRNATAGTSFTEAIQGSGDIFDDSNETSNQLLQHFVSPMAAETTALLIVDVQPEYWSNCPAVRKDFPDFPKNLQRTIEVARQRKAKIIWVRADYRYSHSPWLPQFERIRGDRNLGEVPCDPTSPEFNWEDFAKPQGGEVIITKSSWSSTTNTALMDILRVAGIETVLVCGLITSVCVQHSAFGIFEAGYRTVLVTDACADRGRARHEAALALYGDYMYELVTSEDLESEEHGLKPAEPVWLTLDAKTKMVRANPLHKLRLHLSS